MIHRQRGAAFIYVMLIFIAASLVAAGLMAREQLALARTQRFVEGLQAMQYAYAGEAYARQLLHANLLRHDSDYAAEGWAAPLPPFETDDGTVIRIVVEDLRGRFNINSLLGGDQLAEDRFTELCQQAGMDESAIEAVLVRFRKAALPEDASAAFLAPPELADASELMDFGMRPADYRRIAPYVAALPGVSHEVNMNTASDTVLQAYIHHASKIAAIRDLVRQDGYVKAERLNELAIQSEGLTGESDAFLIRVDVIQGSEITRLASRALMRKDPGREQVAIAGRTWNVSPAIGSPR